MLLNAGRYIVLTNNNLLLVVVIVIGPSGVQFRQ